jgi:hypothetical protein
MRPAPQQLVHTGLDGRCAGNVETQHLQATPPPALDFGALGHVNTVAASVELGGDRRADAARAARDEYDSRFVLQSLAPRGVK